MSNLIEKENETTLIEVKYKQEDDIDENSYKQALNKINKSSNKNSFDINDQNELDYDDELENNEFNKSKEASIETKQNNLNIKSQKCSNEEVDEEGAIEEEESDGELKSVQNTDNDLDDGELASPKVNIVANEEKIENQESQEEEEEDGEINDGEKLKKAFIPRVLCKYYQRGKCTWGRSCKFLHPGVNDTGNYSFLEFQDPNAKVYQHQSENEKSNAISSKAADESSVQTESAWERGLRQAKEMKEKAQRRKLMEKDQFDDKKMNLSLKEFENEKENDERYFNIEKPLIDEDLEDEDLNLFAKTSRLNNDRTTIQGFRSSSSVSGYNDSRNFQYQNKTSYVSADDSRRSQNSQYDYKSRQTGDSNFSRKKSMSPVSKRNSANKQKADEWHDPWDRSRQSNKNKERSNSYSSSGSTSRSKSRSRSGSRSSYSSESSYSYSSRSDSSRSASNSSSHKKSDTKRLKNSAPDRQSRPINRTTTLEKSKPAVAASINPKQLASDLKRKISTLKNVKSLPGRQISDVSLKKAGLDTDKNFKKAYKNKVSRSRSNSSGSSYESSNSKSDDDISNDDSDSYSEEENDDEVDDKRNKKKISSKKVKSETLMHNLKRPAQDNKLGSENKKSKITPSSTNLEKPAASSDKKQMIKDQLKLLESALKKKSMAK